ncbi:DNA polymerase III subunit beta [Patescibacteria group bacterium]|nr:DNA polymerase III subunit beta [Patescibacteria group bacterium]
MKIEILTSNIKEGINNIERLTKKSPSLQVLDNTLLETDKNFLKLISTNLETSMIWWVLAKVVQEGKVAVPASFLNNLINLLREDKIKLRSENKNLILETKNQITQIRGIDPEEFPIIPKIEQKDPIEIGGEKLNQGLSQVVDVPSPSQIRPEISGIYFSFKKDEIKIVGTDSFRLAEKTISLEQKLRKEGQFILPQSSGRELINILAQKTGEVKIYFDPNQVLFEWYKEETSHPHIHLLSRLIEGEYPNYQEIIPKKYTAQIVLDREDFLNQIKEAGLFSGKISEVKLTPIPKENKIKIFAQSPEVGENEAYLAAKIEGEGEIPEVSFNYRFLVDGLHNIKSSEVILRLSDEEGPGVLKPVGDPSYIYILMPIKAS